MFGIKDGFNLIHQQADVTSSYLEPQILNFYGSFTLLNIKGQACLLDTRQDLPQML